MYEVRGSGLGFRGLRFDIPATIVTTLGVRFAIPVVPFAILDARFAIAGVNSSILAVLFAILTANCRTPAANCEEQTLQNDESSSLCLLAPFAYRRRWHPGRAPKPLDVQLLKLPAKPLDGFGYVVRERTQTACFARSCVSISKVGLRGERTCLEFQGDDPYLGVQELAQLLVENNPRRKSRSAQRLRESDVPQADDPANG